MAQMEIPVQFYGLDWDSLDSRVSTRQPLYLPTGHGLASGLWMAVYLPEAGSQNAACRKARILSGDGSP